MAIALLTAFFFSISAIFSQRAARLYGSLRANFFRLCGACLVLGLISRLAFPESLRPEVFQLLLLSGALGFGLGDSFMFLAYPRLGSRLALLLQFCISTLTGAVGDWIFLQRAISIFEAFAIVIILSGLATTLLGKERGERKGSFGWGIAFASASALCMGAGIVVSNLVNSKAAALGFSVPPVSQAWQRTIAGVVVAGIIWRVLLRTQGEDLPSGAATKASAATKRFWLVGTCLIGPVLGVTFSQWALLITGSSAVVLAVAATSAIMIIPLARWLEKDRPSMSEILGSLCAVGGVIWLCLLRRH